LGIDSRIASKTLNYLTGNVLGHFWILLAGTPTLIERDRGLIDFFPLGGRPVPHIKEHLSHGSDIPIEIWESQAFRS
jgi:hypothetical protein